MSQRREIDYSALIDGSIGKFQPAARLLPERWRLALWLLLQAAVLVFGLGFTGLASWPLDATLVAEIAALLLAGTLAAYMALRGAVPGRESVRLYVALAAAISGTISIASLASPSVSGWVPSTVASICALAALPWLALLWALRRGASSYPARTGGLAGAAAFCFAAAEYQLLMGAASPASVSVQAGAAAALVLASAIVGGTWLDPVRRWDKSTLPAEERAGFHAPAAFPLVCGFAAAALMLVLWNVRQGASRVPDFDLAIAEYHQSLSGFRPNVPSDSLEAVLTAYVEHGMPSYMWDFGPEGYKLVGGRIEHLPGGAPITYTWFAGGRGGILCTFRRIDGFQPPPDARERRGHMLFYRYRGFSICLINVGGYGSFMSVIAAPIPMPKFTRIVLRAAG